MVAPLIGVTELESSFVKAVRVALISGDKKWGAKCFYQLGRARVNRFLYLENLKGRLTTSELIATLA